MDQDDNELSRVKTLVAAAEASIGGTRRLARALNQNAGHISAWREGKRPCPVADQALMADMLGLDGEQVALYAMIEREHDPKRKEHLVRVLGKGFKSTTAAAFSAISASALWASDSLNVLYTMYIM